MDFELLDLGEMAVFLDEEEADSDRLTILPGPPDSDVEDREDYERDTVEDAYAYGTENERFLCEGPLGEDDDA